MASEAVYSVWAIPPEDVAVRCANLMTALRSDFGGPQFQPHITLVGAIKLTADDALAKLRSASQALRPFNVTVDRVATGTFFYQCVYLLLRPDPHLLETSAHCCTHFGYASSTRNFPFTLP
ncbi:RNA ligase/cyclic nucleotide phosphodiesterase [Vigna unguiculata]|uniref:RNA ligase/cyclic nucleotide phosphodiesterase n=1 Tax=Vigna unguiculata TaxID=3917 RepID=A0A4D6L7N9_VIGUN|nr:RNA ligase/cyclic nucleotide phosphodiesterase [Vigna unguiculata]